MTGIKSNKIPLLFILISFNLAIISCKKDDVATADIIYTLTGNANGGQEAPNRVTTTASGTITGTYNKNTSILNYTITWTGLSAAPVAMHLHSAADPGIAAPIKIPINNFTAAPSGTITKTDTLKTDVDRADFLLGKWYYNLHTPSNPGGEIRGQIYPTR